MRSIRNRHNKRDTTEGARLLRGAIRGGLWISVVTIAVVGMLERAAQAQCTANPAGQGDDLTLYNGATCTPGHTRASSTAISFDGANDYAAVPADAMFDNLFNGGGTISAWVYPKRRGGYRGIIITKGSNTPGVYTGWNLQYHDVTQHLKFERVTDATDGGWQTNGGAVPLNQWSHIALAYDDSSNVNEPVIYVDGVSQTVTETDTPTGTMSSDATHVLFVGNHTATRQAFKGSIDHPRVWNRTLSASEMKNLYASRGEWLFNDFAGSSLTDASDYNSTGNLSGAVWTDDTYEEPALIFDGVDDYVSVASHTDRNNIFAGGGTISAWIYATSWGESGGGHILSKKDASDVNGWSLYMGGRDTALYFRRNFSDSDGSWRTPTNSMTLNRWHHVAVTYNDSSTSYDPAMYIDGIARTITEASTPAGIAQSDAPYGLVFGNDTSAGGASFEGLIRVVGVYKRILRASDVIELATTCSVNGFVGCTQ